MQHFLLRASGDCVILLEKGGREHVEQPFSMNLLSPAEQESAHIRRNANFAGACLVSVLLVQYAIRLLNRLGLLDGVLSLVTTYEAAMLADMVVYVLVLAIPPVVVALCTKQWQTPFPTRRVSAVWWIVLVCGGMALAIVSNVITGVLMNMFSSVGIPSPELPDTVRPEWSSLLLNLVSTALLPALIEEMVFRGYLLGALRRHGDALAIVLTAVLFGFFHGNILQFPFAFILGLGLGYAVVKTDSIWPAVVLHGANNAMSVLITYFQKYLPAYATAISEVTFLGVAAIGVTVLTAAHSRRGFFGSVGNGVSYFPVRVRVGKILSAPLMILAIIAMTFVLAESIRSSLL